MRATTVAAAAASVGILLSIPLRSQGTDPAIVGQWSAVQHWPAVAVHAHLLPTGQVFFFSYVDDPRLWNPQTGAFTTAPLAGYNIFCTGHSFLPDGRLHLTGGHISNGVGLDDASIYDPFTNTWTRLPDMNAGRWYPTNTTLADGSVLTVSGSFDTNYSNNTLPQVWTPGGAVGSWRDLSTATLALPLYPFMFLAPNGRVFTAGPQAQARYLDTAGTGSWSNVGSSTGRPFRDYGTALMYDVGKVLVVGGVDPPTAAAEVIDLNQSSPQWRGVGPMATARRQLNSTVLPDGTVLVTGGSRGNGFDNQKAPVFTAEVWSPVTEQWTTLASATQYRGYHSTALLLPDGRVLSAGGDTSRNAEVFSPPYLFKGARPSVTTVPGTAGYGQAFFVETPEAASIATVSLVRLSSVTHAFNMDQRFLRLSFTQAAGGLTVTGPPAPEVAPPGYYLLFLVNQTGVPSVGRFIRIGGTIAPTVPSAPTALTASAASSSIINVAWTDTSANEQGFQLERSTDGSTFALRATLGANATSFQDTGLPGSTQYWYRARAFNAVGSSPYSNIGTATTLAPQPPAAPTNLQAATARGRISLTWTDRSADEDGFKVERSTNNSTWAQIATTAANAATYVDTAYPDAKFVYYRVRAYRGSLNSAYTSSVKVRPPRR